MSKKTLTVNEVVTINEVLVKIANAGLTGKVAYLAYRNLSKTAKIADDYQKTRNEMIQKYGEPDPEVEGQVVVKRESPNYKKFVEELTEILAGTEEVELYQIPDDALDKLADADLSVSDFAIVDNYLVVHPEAPKAEEKADEGEKEEAEASTEA